MFASARAGNYDSSLDCIGGQTRIFDSLSWITPSRIAEFTVGACLQLVERSTISEPHFIWEDLNSVVISPSDYQFTLLEDANYEFVSIDDEDIPYREFCSQALDSLELYEGLSDDWDDDGALAPSPSSLVEAHLLLRILSSRLCKCPNIVAMLDFEGIPSFAFDSAARYVSVAFYGQERLVTYTLNRTTNTSSSQEFMMNDVDALQGFIQSIESL